jgi:hypothetical protein
MSMVIDCAHPDDVGCPPRWNRFERAERYGPYRKLPAQGVSQRQAAKELQVPRTTLQAWRRGHDTLDSCPHVAQFFHNGPGLAFLPRLVLALPLVCVEVGACGIRLVCLFLTLTGLDRFVAASSGAQPQVNRPIAEALVSSRQAETARLAKDMPRKDLPLTQDETFPGGLCLVGSEPVSTFIILEPLACARDPTTWNARMAPALAALNCQGIHSTSDEAPGLLAYVAQHLGAHHSPDLFHGQHELSKAVSAPLAAKERAAHKATTEAQERLDQGQAPLQPAHDNPPARGPGRPPQEPRSLAQARQELDAARRAHERLAQQRAQGAQSLRAIGQAYHCVDLERGVRRNGQRIVDAIQAPMEQIRAIAQEEDLSQRCLDRLEKAARGAPKMRATIAFVSGYVRQQGRQRGLPPPASCAMHARLMPSYDLDRVAQTRTVTAGEPLRALAERLRAPLCEPGGTLGQRSAEAQDQLHQKAKTLAEVFQRSSSNVEGRNGYLSLRNHPLRGLDRPRKRECLTAIHHFFLTRPDGTTAAERFFGQKPRSMFTAILASVETAARTPPSTAETLEWPIP